MANANDGNQVDQQVHPYNLHVSLGFAEYSLMNHLMRGTLIHPGFIPISGINEKET